VRAPLVAWLREQVAVVPLSTHGVTTYHRSPTECRRWTHAGLEKLFVDNGVRASVRVTPASGTTACLGMLLAMYLDPAFRRLGLLARPLVVALYLGAGAVDRLSSRLREPGAGVLFAKYHVVAEVPR